MPHVIELRFADGSVRRETWDGRSERHCLTTERGVALRGH
jgi:hypothetical protein